MSWDYGLTLQKYLVNISLLSEIARRKKMIARGLSCICKDVIITNYTRALKNVMISLTGLIHRITHRSAEQLEDAVKSVVSIFRQEAYDETYYGKNVSPKMLFLFELTQKALENAIFDEISREITPNKRTKTRAQLHGHVLAEIYDLAEVAILNLSGVRLDPRKLSDNMFNTRHFVYDKEKVLPFDRSKIVGCPFANGSKYFENEILHIFLCDRLLSVRSWIVNYIEILRDYFEEVGQLILVLDFKLVSEKDWTSDVIEFWRSLKLDEIFGKVYCTNCSGRGYELDFETVDLEKIYAPDALCYSVSKDGVELEFQNGTESLGLPSCPLSKFKGEGDTI